MPPHNYFHVARRSHPASIRGSPPPCLAKYHQCTEEFEDLEFDDTMFANVIRSYNSEDGVTPDAWFLFITCKVYCMGCTRTFSHDGYSAHIREQGHCPWTLPSSYATEVTKGMCFALALQKFALTSLFIGFHHPALSVEPPSALRQYHPNYDPPTTLDLFRTTMIGRAFLEWNSSVGISMDAWTTITTAYIHCDGCNRFRSFDGDNLHRDRNGLPYCGGRTLDLHDSTKQPVIFTLKQEGDGAIVSGKGKGKEQQRQYIYVPDSDDDL